MDRWPVAIQRVSTAKCFRPSRLIPTRASSALTVGASSPWMRSTSTSTARQGVARGAGSVRPGPGPGGVAGCLTACGGVPSASASWSRRASVGTAREAVAACEPGAGSASRLGGARPDRKPAFCGSLIARRSPSSCWRPGSRPALGAPRSSLSRRSGRARTAWTGYAACVARASGPSRGSRTTRTGLAGIGGRKTRPSSNGWSNGSDVNL